MGETMENDETELPHVLLDMKIVVKAGDIESQRYRVVKLMPGEAVDPFVSLASRLLRPEFRHKPEPIYDLEVMGHDRMGEPCWSVVTDGQVASAVLMTALVRTLEAGKANGGTDVRHPESA